MSDSSVAIFNPLNDDFTVKYDENGNGDPVSFTIKAKSVAKFAPHIANHITKHLATAIYDLRGNPKFDREIQMDAYKKEISMQ